MRERFLDVLYWIAVAFAVLIVLIAAAGALTVIV